MSAIHEYHRYKQSLESTKKWLALIGARYEGGGGGTGYVHGVHTEFTIYHQAYDGATNYHEMPNRDFQIELDRAVYNHLKEIIKSAISEMEKNLSELAVFAKAEAETITKDTGLITGS